MVNMLIYRSPAVLPAGDLQINMLNITTPVNVLKLSDRVLVS